MRHAATANHGPRRGGDAPSLIVLHYTAMRGGPDPVVALFQRPDVELSAHYVLGEDGAVVAMVPEDRRAWHAGAGSWGDVCDVNSASVGIEICNDGASPFPAAQMDALERLVAAVALRHRIPPERVLGHSDVAPGRKIDPGRRFDWRRLARVGLAIWPGARDPREPDAATFRRHLLQFGYSASVPDDLLRATFRLRFRPGAFGPLDDCDMALAADLAARFPCPIDASSVEG